MTDIQWKVYLKKNKNSRKDFPISLYHLIQTFPKTYHRKINRAFYPCDWDAIVKNIQTSEYVDIPMKTPEGYGSITVSGRHFFNGRYYLMY